MSCVAAYPHLTAHVMYSLTQLSTHTNTHTALQLTSSWVKAFGEAVGRI